MAKLGPFTYPDIRFGDAVEIAGRIFTKFKGTVSVKGLAWELGMAEGSGTLFAKVAALRDFGLIEGRGELHTSPLAQRILQPASPEEGRQARAEAFHKVELLRQLYHRFEGEIPDDLGLLIGLEELTKAPREEVLRRSSLIQKHLTDAVRVLGRPTEADKTAEHSKSFQNIGWGGTGYPSNLEIDGLVVGAGKLHFSAPLTTEYIDVAIGLLTTLRAEVENRGTLTQETVKEVEDTTPSMPQEARNPVDMMVGEESRRT